MESASEATTRSTTTRRRSSTEPAMAGARRSAAAHPDAQVRTSQGAWPGSADQARMAAYRACPAVTSSATRMPTAAPDGPFPKATRPSTATVRTPPSTMRFVASGRYDLSCLEQAAVERQQHEDRRRRQDGGDADAAALTQQDRHPVPAGEDDDGPDQDRHRTVPVQATGPATDLVGRSLRVPTTSLAAPRPRPRLIPAGRGSGTDRSAV